MLEPAPSLDEARVIVSFLPVGNVALSPRGIDSEQASDLRQRLKSFAEDWDRPEMDVYDAL